MNGKLTMILKYTVMIQLVSDDTTQLFILIKESFWRRRNNLFEVANFSVEDLKEITHIIQQLRICNKIA